MSCTSNNLPPNQFYFLSPGTGWQSTQIVQKHFGHFGKSEKMVTRKVLFYYPTFSKNNRSFRSNGKR